MPAREFWQLYWHLSIFEHPISREISLRKSQFAANGSVVDRVGEDSDNASITHGERNPPYRLFRRPTNARDGRDSLVTPGYLGHCEKDPGVRTLLCSGVAPSRV